MNDVEDFSVLLLSIVDKFRAELGEANNFIQKIDQASNSTEKLKILLLFLCNDFPISKLFCNSDKINNFLHRISLITNECPSDFDMFMKWLPNFIQSKNKTIISIQKRVSGLQHHIRELLDFITKLNINGNIKGFTEKESKIFSDLKFFEEDNSIKNETVNLQNNDKCHQIKNDELVKLLSQVKSLNQRNEQFRVQIENYKIKTDNLVKELSINQNQTQKINELESENLKLKEIINRNETKYQSTIISLNQKINNQNQIIQSKKKMQEEFQNTNSELDNLRFLLENSRKEIEIYKSQFYEISNIFQNRDSNEKSQNDLNIEIESKLIKERIFKLQNECIKFKTENEKITSNQNFLFQKVSRLESSLEQINEENQQLKNELQTYKNLSSSSIYETIDRLKSQNDELKKSFLKITQNKFNFIKENNDEKSVSTQNSFNENSSTFTSDENLSIVREKNNEINSLKRRIVSLEAEKIKLADSLKKFQVNKNLNPEKNILNLKKVGFLLADALSQRYNPSRVPFEINRLIEIVRSEHIQLCESTRVPLDPFIRYNEDENTRLNVNQKKNLFSGFDELDSQISAIKSYA